jgi:hypothetical protein
MNALAKLLWPVGRYVWALLRLPQTVDNHMGEMKGDVAEIKRDVKDVIREQAHQRGICEQTRRSLGLYE